MKKMISLVLLSLIISTICFAGIAKAADNSDGIRGKKIKITIYIEFGKKTLDCKRFGFCDWGITLTGQPQKGGLAVNQALGEVFFNDNGQIVVEFKNDYMGSVTESTYFRNGIFKVEEDFIVPREILDKLEYKRDYIIKNGQYTVLEKDRSLVVVF